MTFPTTKVKESRVGWAAGLALRSKDADTLDPVEGAAAAVAAGRAAAGAAVAGRAAGAAGERETAPRVVGVTSTIASAPAVSHEERIWTSAAVQRTFCWPDVRVRPPGTPAEPRSPGWPLRSADASRLLPRSLARRPGQHPLRRYARQGSGPALGSLLHGSAGGHGDARALGLAAVAQPVATATARPVCRPENRQPPRNVPSSERYPCMPPPPNPATPPAAYRPGSGSPSERSTRPDRSVSRPPRVLRVITRSRMASSGPAAGSSRRCGGAVRISGSPR